MGDDKQTRGNGAESSIGTLVGKDFDCLQESFSQLQKIDTYETHHKKLNR